MLSQSFVTVSRVTGHSISHSISLSNVCKDTHFLLNIWYSYWRVRFLQPKAVSMWVLGKGNGCLEPLMVYSDFSCGHLYSLTEHWQFKPGIVGLVLGLIPFVYFSKKHTITTIILLDRQPIEAINILSIIVVYPSLLMSQTQLTPVWIAFSIVQTRSALGLVGSGLRDDIVDKCCFSSHPTIPCARFW